MPLFEWPVLQTQNRTSAGIAEHELDCIYCGAYNILQMYQAHMSRQRGGFGESEVGMSPGPELEQIIFRLLGEEN
jgi:hypothetical protein